MKKVIVVHGIGDTKKGYSKEWTDILKVNHPDKNFKVEELYWEDVSDNWRASHDSSIIKPFAEALDYSWLSELISSDAYKKISDFFFDFGALACNNAYRKDLLSKVSERLIELYNNDKQDTIIIAHSLGAAIIPQVLMLIEKERGYSLDLQGLILLASPLGIKTPLPKFSDDMLSILLQCIQASETNQLKTGEDALEYFSKEMSCFSKGNLKFLINPQDFVCSDPKYEINFDSISKFLKQKFSDEINEIPKDGIKLLEIDVLPKLKQGFNVSEIEALKFYIKEPISYIANAGNNIIDILKNHSVEHYLNSEEFKTIFNKFLGDVK